MIYQSLYPGNRGLFQRAIAESGSLGSPWGFAYNTSAHATFKKCVGAVGCKGNKTQIMTCIRNVPSQKIQDLLRTEKPNIVVVPTVDGEFVKKSPSEVFKPATDMTDVHVL